jgi:hypothetical protein
MHISPLQDACGTPCFMSSLSFCHQVDSSSSAILLLYAPQRQTRGFILIGVLLTLAGGEGQGAIDLFSDGSLWCGLHLGKGDLKAYTLCLLLFAIG